MGANNSMNNLLESFNQDSSVSRRLNRLFLLVGSFDRSDKRLGQFGSTSAIGVGLVSRRLAAEVQLRSIWPTWGLGVGYLDQKKLKTTCIEPASSPLRQQEMNAKAATEMGIRYHRFWSR
jgi:hypothetical protein